MRRTEKLGPIHYDEQLLIDFWDQLVDYSDSHSSTFKVYHGSATTEFEDPQELKNATQIPDRISRFELSLVSSNGTVRISANSNKHEYTIEGDEDWVRRLSDYIDEFGSEQRNELRNLFSNERIRAVQFSFIGAMVLFWEKIVALLLPFYFIDLPSNQWRIFIGLVAGVILLQVSKWVYPTVVFRRRDSPSLVRRAAFLVTLIGSVLSIVQGFYWLI